MSGPVRIAVFPAAGLGTRFLPATKASPKEMLPIVDKPLIQYAAEEAAAAGIELMIFIIGRTKRAISDHFDKAFELEVELEQRQKTKMLEIVRNILPATVATAYIRQAEALGLGHAVLCAEPLIGKQPFAVLLADDLIKSDGKNCLQQMIESFQYHRCSILGVEPIPREHSKRYGVVEVKSCSEEKLFEVKSIVEKPSPENAPSNLGVVGRYLLTPEIFNKLRNIKPGSGGEIQLTDAIQALISEERILALRFEGKRFDCGDKLGYLQANVEYGLEHEHCGDDFRAYLKSLQL
jgi:UTP--glucose-1-phosphate uridylyltransferase